jgi:nucleoside 2-deoxyribosyltransferase
MQILYSDQPSFEGGTPSIFLAGPTPRSQDVLSWRPTAIDILKNLGFQGTVLVPERHDGNAKTIYIDQVEWEYAGLSRCTRICIWVPRTMTTMPALTTNVEFGYWLAKSKDRVRYGRPQAAVNTRYLDWLYYKETGRLPDNDLTDLLQECF